MRGEFVAVDLETTGLDPVRDAIIEIGAARFVDGQLTEEFSTFVDPARPIPEFISRLTGITDDMVHGAPQPAEAVDRLRAFVGQAPVVGHNVGFDLGFLVARGALRGNTRIDTYDLACVLLPRAPRYNLGSLADQLGHTLRHAHRALDDARATGEVLNSLWQRLLALPEALVLEITEAARAIEWDGRYCFEHSLRERGISERFSGEFPPIFTQPAPEAVPLEATPGAGGDFAPESIERTFTQDGPLAAVFARFEDRPQQRQMARAVAQAFVHDDSVMIEAGTGTGKSMAYLAPAAEWALHTGDRVIISTNTINLQEQLLLHDVPILQQAIGRPVRTALLKGRGNYLCPRRFDYARRRRVSSPEELRMLARLLVWTHESQSGDRGEISLRRDEEYFWARLNAEDEGCTENQCRSHMDGVCPFHRARQAAASAHLVVVNHALLTADALAERPVLPPYDRVIIDEAHQFEDAVTSGLSTSLDEPGLRRHLADIGTPTTGHGLLGGMGARLAAEGFPERDASRITSYAADVAQAAAAMAVRLGRLFGLLRAVAREKSESNGDYTPSLRVVRAVRETTAFVEAAAYWRDTEEYIDAVASALSELHSAIARRATDSPGMAELLGNLSYEARFLHDTLAWLKAFFEDSDRNRVYWLTLFQNNEYVGLHSAPIHIGGMVDETLFQKKKTVILTSATLQVNGSFAYLRNRLGAEHAATLDVGTPFNYRDSTMLFLPNDMADPSDRNRFQSQIEQAILELAGALGGRTMALFTSYAQLRTTASAIGPRLSLGGIVLYDQSDGSNRQALLEGFRTSPRAVLLGTRSFWEGVDVPGDALSALVIVKLPFAVPNDPIIAARQETFNDAFREYSIPDAILRFRQGFGRLIRSRTDRGIVTVLDGRILRKGYGSQFIDALPECTLQTAPLAQLAPSAERWLGQTR
jgi:DNA polymerase-3 subunit epsilon/ATP-dependent DNA helicase DinG